MAVFGGFGTEDWPRGAHPPPPCEEIRALHLRNLERIEPVSVRQAYEYLTCAAADLPGFCCFPSPKGYLADFRYYAKGQWPYAFIINKRSLLFYFRPPSLRFPFSQTETELRELFGDSLERKRGEFGMHVFDRKDAELLHQVIQQHAPSSR
jgi:hypothetical protein